MPDIYIKDLIIPKFDDVLTDILEHKHTHYTFPGGRGGTKSSFIGLTMPLLITQFPNIHGVAFRRYANTLKDSVYAEIMSGIGKIGMYDYFKAKISPLEIIYKPTGQKIMFRGFDEPDKIKSIKVPFGYIGATWFEEKDQFPGGQSIRTATISTMRGGDMFWNFESFNPPISVSNWANEELLIERPDRLIVRSNYLDVPPEWLGQQFIDEAEFLLKTNERAYRHEYLGEPVGTGGMVFENIIKRRISDEEIAGFDNIRNGIDFGYYPDPWAFNRMQYIPAKRQLIIFDEAWRKKCGSAKTAEVILEHGLGYNDLIICDNNDNETIDDYKDYGLMARPARKGAKSREYSFKWLQTLDAIIIDPVRCPATYKEFTEYEYERDKDENIIMGYPDGNGVSDHHIDAVRYATEPIWRRRGQ